MPSANGNIFLMGAGDCTMLTRESALVVLGPSEEWLC